MTDFFERIKKSINDNPSDPILSFGEFRIMEYIDGGQQGQVLKVKNKIGKSFALKFMRPKDDEAPEIVKDAIKNFNREVKILVTLYHKNIVQIYSGGRAEWIENKNTWNLERGLSEKVLEKNEVLYYIMAFIDGEHLGKMFPILSKDHQNLDNYLKNNEANYYDLKKFEKLISQISQALSYHHEKGVTHKDIKPKNILYSKSDENFIIVDYGFAHHYTSPQRDDDIVHVVEMFDFDSYTTGNYELNDLGQFSRILLNILPLFKKLYDPNRYIGIENVLIKAHLSPIIERFQDVESFYQTIIAYLITLGEWKFQLKLGEFMAPNSFGQFNSKLRIPVSGSILLSDEVKKIIDTPEFQRLRGVRQLGPTIFVYPGANHTRFEHSLGTYYLALQYLEKLLKFPDFKEKIHPLESNIKYFVLTALLHDIGHYPYSHWIEEIGEFPNGIKLPKHEERAKKIITGSKIEDIVKNEWEIDTENLFNIISGKPVTGTSLINSFINSIIDVDKIDYLRRDSIHCGVKYGEGIDLERLLDSLFYDPQKETIILTEKGGQVLHAIISCRNIMYRTIYWHKTVRCCEAMFKRFFYEFVKINQESNEISKIFDYSDDQFTYILHEQSKTKPELCKLISPFSFRETGRRIFKPLYLFYYQAIYDESHATENFFNKISDYSFQKLVKMSNRIVEQLRIEFPRIQIDDYDVLLEITPLRGGYEYSEQLPHFKIWSARKGTTRPIESELKELGNYLKKYKQAFLFCSPDIYDLLSKLFQNEDRREEFFLKLLLD